MHRRCSVSGVGDAQMPYIGAADERTLRPTLKVLRNRPVLVVADPPDALAASTRINFVVIDGHVRFEFSMAAARRSGFTLGCEWLSLTRRLEGGLLGHLAAARRALASGVLEGAGIPRRAAR
jgi:hypothetical protein